MKMMPKFVAVAVLLSAQFTFAAEAPHIAYVFPAGGQAGSTFEIEIGGQFLQGTTNVFVTGAGVDVELLGFGIRYEPRRFQQLVRNRKNDLEALEETTGENREKLLKKIQRTEALIELADLPEGIDPYDIKTVKDYFKKDDKEQFNPQISDRLHARVRIQPDAPPDDRALRVYTPQGLSNPIYFQTGILEEVLEAEPNDDHMSPDLQTVPVPSVINGQVRPGDIDHFRFKAAQGDSIVVNVGARRIIPYLADAVPGWFQAVVAIYDEDGKEVAYQDDYKFNPDPVLFFDVPKAGNYTLSIRDSIYRGREDFIYRIAIGELPFITGIFPLGARRGQDVDIALSGRNLPKSRLAGMLPDEVSDLRHVSVWKGDYRSNQMPFSISDLDEVFEAEPNDSEAAAQAVVFPTIVNGRMGKAGDRDVFKFEGKKGDSISFEVFARRLNSPLDSVLTLTGPGIDIPVRADDMNLKDAKWLYLGDGLMTHHADSHLLYELPASGTYFVELADTQNKGGHDYAYRLRLGHSRPDFTLRMEPSGIQIAPGGTAAFSVLAQRMDGYDGEIVLEADALPDGFVMSQTVIPKGGDSARFTITAPRQITGELVSPKIRGTATIDGKEIHRPAVPVDDQMQAFLYRHLVPANELVLAPVQKRPPVAFEARLPKSGIIPLQAGEETRIMLEGYLAGPKRGCTVKLDNPPEGFHIVKNGWIGKQKLKDKNGNDRFDKNKAVGSILISVDETVAPGTQLSLVVAAEVKNGKDIISYPAPAIPVKVVRKKK
ncbi:hypothetical protein P4E94_16065 [Pontiellaceae bacterium B12219]|nr:hypothetical protein [Pontiellaceae bacterium B12219]